MATSAPPKKDSPLVLVKKYLPQIGLVGAGLVIVYGVSKIGMSVAGGLLSLDIYTTFRYGFWTGLIVAAGGAFSFFYVGTVGRISPDKAFAKAIARVQSSRLAQEKLGMNIRPGMLKAYVHERGHFSLGRKMSWVEPRMQMLVEVEGELGRGMVTAEAVKHKNGLVLTLCAVDTVAKPNAPAQVLLLKGDEDRLHVRGTLRGFLQAERAAYIPQDKDALDDDRKVLEQQILPTEAEQDAEARVIDKYPTPGRA